MPYDFKCECGSVFMTDWLLKSHQEKKACKPNQVYTLNVSVRPRLHKKPPSTKCATCDGKGWIVMGNHPRRKEKLTRPCPQNCAPAKDEYESFVRNAWAQVGSGVPGPSPMAQHEDAQTGPDVLALSG